ncbi:MAG: ECF transporter S component [Anaerolineales bacterium]|jgi:energy-coupling factor transport system substrate-specific component|nr:ECF transporter S component [Anaerolineales bacterium]MBK9781676.1 ECF transporter S component [Anaerolineales bacterium]
MLDKIKSNFNTQTWVLIPIAIAINIAVGQIVLVLKLPVFLDSIGTVLVAVLCGPWAGALTGALSNVIWGIAIDPGALPWWPVAAMIGYMAGRMAGWGFFKSWWKVVVTGFVVALTAAIVSTPIAVYLFGGITASGSSFITAYLLQTGQGIWSAVVSTSFLTEPVDKITTAMIAFAIIQGLPKRTIGGYPKANQVATEGGASSTQLYIAIGVVVALVLFAAFMLRNILGG